ncbi:MAG: hypothetical protein CSA38_02810 [Flavobacteriales bacterium]|nr:MAG: hypothetical protein CSA38_02810 [Flavobacteriales bacterium]
MNKTPANIQDNGLYGLNHYMRVFDFGDSIQLGDLPPFGDDHSYIENKQLKAPIKMGEHKGLGRKFWFDRNGGEPNEVEMEFKIWLPESFQKNGTENEVGKFLGFEGIYDQTAGWGGKKVTNQNSWSVRIGHAREDSEGKIPIGLYIYHPEMKGKYGTSIDTNFALEKEQTHTLKLYIKLNDINQKNGVIKLFVNGEEIYSSNTWLLRKKAWVHTRSVWLNAYIGGLTPSLNDTYVIYDDLKIKW